MYEVETSSRQKNNELRWLATDTHLNCYTLGVSSLMVTVLTAGGWSSGASFSGKIKIYCLTTASQIVAMFSIVTKVYICTCHTIVDYHKYGQQV